MKREEYKTISKRAQLLLAKEEGCDVEFKVSLSGLTSQDIVAFANSDSGGAILIGVDESQDEIGQQIGIIKGCSIGDREKLSIINKAESCIPPVSVEIYIENSSKTPFYRIEIASGENKPHCSSGGTYKIRGDGRTKALSPSRLLNMFLMSENQEFLERFREATSDLETGLLETKSKIITEINSLLPIIQEMEGKIEYSLDDIFGSAQNAESQAEEANAFSDETLFSVQELRGKLEEIDDYALTNLDKKLDALLNHFGLEDPRIKKARQQVEIITKEKHDSGMKQKDIIDLLSKLWDDRYFNAAWSEVIDWHKAAMRKLTQNSKKDDDK
jgi:hypothetical protein